MKSVSDVRAYWEQNPLLAFEVGGITQMNDGRILIT